MAIDCFLCDQVLNCNANVVDKNQFMTFVTQALCLMGGESGGGSQTIEYAICDDEVQKIVQICFINCVPGPVVYLDIERLPTTEPVDWGLVRWGACSDVGDATAANQVIEIGLLEEIRDFVDSIDTKTPPLGQALMANSTPVVIASNQSAIPITAASLPLPTGAATSALQTTGNTSLSSIDGKFPAAAALSDAQANPTTTRIGAELQIFNGLSWDRARGDTAFGQDVDVTRSVLPTGAATSALQNTQNISIQSTRQIDQQFTAAFGTLVLGYDLNLGDFSAIPILGGTIPISGAVFTIPQTGRVVLANVTTPTTTPLVSIPSCGAVYIAVRGTYSNLAFTVQAEADSATGAVVPAVPLMRITDPAVISSLTSGLTNVVALWLVMGGPGFIRIQLNVSAISSGTANFVLITPTASTDNIVGAYQAAAWNVGITGTVPLPTGAATAALQTTGNTSLSSIDTKLTTTNTSLSSIDGKFTAAVALSDAQANPTTTRVGADIQIWNGATWDRAPGNVANGQDVDVTRTPYEQFTDSGTKLALLAAIRGARFVTSATTTTGSTTTVLNITTNVTASVRKGDLAWMKSGTLADGFDSIGIVESVAVGAVTLNSTTPFAAAPPTARSIWFYRHTPILTNSSGTVNIYGDVSGSHVTNSPVPGNKFFPDPLTLDAASIALGGGSFVSVGTTGTQWWVGTFSNGTDAMLAVSTDGGSSTRFIMPVGCPPVVYQWCANGGYLDGGTDIQVRYIGAAPTIGDFVAYGDTP